MPHRISRGRPSGRMAVLALGALLALAIGCGGSGSPASAPGATPSGSSPTPTPEPKPVVVGLDATLSGSGGAVGEAVRRGVAIAIDELNGQGGINGRPLELVTRDNEGSPTRGVSNVRELVERERAAAVLSGGQTPIVSAQADVAQQLKVPFVVLSATGRGIVPQGRQSSYVFRVAGNDAAIAQLIAGQLSKRLGRQSPAILVEDSAWGETNLETLARALGEAGLKAALAEKLKPGEAERSGLLSRVRDANADSLVLVADAAEAAEVLGAQARQGLDASARPVIVHAGAGAPGGADGANGVQVVQTYSFLGDQPIPGKRVILAYRSKYQASGPQDIAAPAAVANGFDAMHLVARALRQAADPADGDAARQALENLQTPYDGLIKTYQRPFTPDSHEALAADDYVLATWKDGQLVPDRSLAR